MKTKRILQPLLVAAFSATLLSAQPTPPTPAQAAADIVTRLTSLLDLSTAQQSSATTIFTTEQNTLSTVRSNMQTAQSALQTAALANNTSGISTAASTIGSLGSQQATAVATANAAFYVTLTSTQQTKYTSLNLFSVGGGPGPGGRGGPPRGGPGGPGPGGR